MEREEEIARVTLVGSIVNLLLIVMKLVAGFVGHSAAMISDAVHSVSDFVTDIVVLVFVRISAQPEDESHDYGHGKYETIATLMMKNVRIRSTRRKKEPVRQPTVRKIK